MKKILFIAVCCLLFCGCGNKEKQYLYCLEEQTLKDYSYMKVDFYIYFDKKGLASKVCQQSSYTFEKETNALSLYQSSYESDKNAHLKKNILTIDYHCEEDDIEKQTIEEEKANLEEMGFKCEIRNTND